MKLDKQGTAEKGVDYTVAIAEGADPIVIAAGETEATVTLILTPADDMMFEGEDGETIEIRGSTPGGHRVTSTTIALVDNNLIPLEYVMVEPNMLAEDDSTGTEVLITVKLMGTSGYDLDGWTGQVDGYGQAG